VTIRSELLEFLHAGRHSYEMFVFCTFLLRKRRKAMKAAYKRNGVAMSVSVWNMPKNDRIYYGWAVNLEHSQMWEVQTSISVRYFIKYPCFCTLSLFISRSIPYYAAQMPLFQFLYYFILLFVRMAYCDDF
jgi:hypothetical protein